MPKDHVMNLGRALGVAQASLRCVVGVLLCCVGCDGTVDVVVETPPGALRVELRDTDLALPEELRDGIDIASLPCSDTQLCPPPIDAWGFSCVDGACDPDAVEIVLPVGDVVDFEQLNTELSQIVGDIERIRIDFVRYTVLQNDLNAPVQPVELAWGPAQATDLMDALPLGRIEQWGLGTHDVELHDGGTAALSDFLINTSRQIRIFARTEVDFAPGQRLPLGALAADLQLSITVTGRVL